MAEETTMLTVTGSSISAFILPTLLSSRSPSSEVVLQELTLTSEYSDGTALMGLGGFFGDVSVKNLIIIRSSYLQKSASLASFELVASF